VDYGRSPAITDRTFVVRRALRLNDALPGEKAEHRVWPRGPWLMIDRMKGTVTALHLPDYDPAISNVIWFRDYAAYCGLTTSGKQLYAVVAQIAARRSQAGAGEEAVAMDPGGKPVAGLRRRPVAE